MSCDAPLSALYALCWIFDVSFPPSALTLENNPTTTLPISTLIGAQPFLLSTNPPTPLPALSALLDPQLLQLAKRHHPDSLSADQPIPRFPPCSRLTQSPAALSPILKAPCGAIITARVNMFGPENVAETPKNPERVSKYT
ncbi:uncharacterized protein EV420DRAFT_1649436 [Desarmillaria tabescens]|uniref:Uncharacterized protein n=1 Tax=Armillaria tabescens TaxID=1929756 RepID=A0AA39JKI7_ARMTA|nr:uncharacterized protein EV420DRAFT_1649436 [Desarmillaria tabescens]KAK0443019.1 hypothetical protein EV420DRAFT_1649436 [Desarmillaria tabescens]